MKSTKVLKLTLIILIIILLSIISFAGAYTQNKNVVENILPNYHLARDLNGYTMVEFKVKEENTDDENKNEIDSLEETKENKEETNQEENQKEAEGNEESSSKTENETQNSDSKANLTKENYEKSKQIILKRLASMQISDYIIRQNQENGDIILELPRNSTTDAAVSEVASTGKFEIVDSETEEVLMTNDDIKSAKSGYGSNSSGVSLVYINIQFNKEGTEKFKNITKTYVNTTKKDDEEKKEDTDTAETNQVNEEAEVQETEKQENVENTEEGATTNNEEQEETKAKKITIKLDDTVLTSFNFEQEVTNGLLQLTMGSSSSTIEELKEYYTQANNLTSILDSGKMPINYELERSKYVTTNIKTEEIKTIIIVAIVVFTIALCLIVLIYKGKGILGAISLIGYVAVLLLAVRYFNVEISIVGICEILVSIAISYAILISILKQKQILNTIGKWTVALIPALIIAICLTFANISIGAVLFWGLTIALLYHISITNLLLRD